MSASGGFHFRIPTMRAFSIGILLTLAATAAQADAATTADGLSELFARGRPTWTLDIDNDSLLLNRADGLYTSGLRVSGNYRVRDADGWRSAGWRIGQQLYTAKNAQLYPEQLSPRDRPYAGWLYGGLFYRIERSDGSELAFGLDLGCLGPCAGGRPVQKFFHRLLDQPQPQGWDTQLSNEWGIVAQFGGRSPYWRLGGHADLRAGIAARVGNIFTDVAGDLTLRAGALQVHGGGRLYGFLRGSLRAVGYDATLQGGMFAGDEPRAVEPRRLTRELEAGMQWQRGAWAVRASVVARGSEIRGVPHSQGGQDFARLSISYSP
jgi:hypothetical protein